MNYQTLVFLKPMVGTMSMTGKDTNGDDIEINSTAYPLLEWAAKYRGEYYNNIGLGFDSYSQYDINIDTVKKNEIYAIWI